MKLQAQVIAFHRLFNQSIAPSPSVPDKKTIDLRVRLIAEEAFEIFEALYGQQPEWEMCQSMIANVLLTKEPRVDLAKFADGCGDLDYVVEGSRLEFGIDGESVAAAIHEANMAKVGGATGPDGKKLKPLQWQPPDIEGVLAKQASGELPNVGLRESGRVHFQPDPDDAFVCFDPSRSPFRVGWPGDSFTDDLDKVTCKECLKDEGRL